MCIVNKRTGIAAILFSVGCGKISRNPKEKIT
jgi:hypothetical protein